LRCPRKLGKDRKSKIHTVIVKKLMIAAALVAAATTDTQPSVERRIPQLCTVLLFPSCLVLFQATSRHAFPLCLLLVFVCLYLYPSRTHGIASRGSVYVFFRVEMPCYLCMSVNAIPLPYTLSLHGSHEFTTYNIPHHTGQASSPANKDKTILQRMIDNWEDRLYSGDTCRTFTSELP